MSFLRAMDSGVRNALCVWHRRSGKDKTFLNFMIKEMMTRSGNYYYVFPTYAQGKKALWENIGKDGFPFIGHFQKEIISGAVNNTEMKIRLKNGSLFQVVGSDKIDSVMGTNPVGIVYSEYSLQDPSASEYMSPIILENGGWQVFNMTPRGKNHGYELLNNVRDNPKWFTEILTIDDTGVITPEMIQSERDRGVSEEHIQQEYYCSFNGPMEGAVYGPEMRAMQSEGRICRVPYDPALLVDTWWDIGVGNPTAIWFTQTSFSDVRLIDYYEDSGKGMDFYAAFVAKKKYNYREHNAPHDVEQRQKNTGKTLTDYAKDLGLKFNVCPRTGLAEGINASRAFLRRVIADRDNCHKGIDALQAYRFKYDAKREIFTDTPYHNHASNGADAFRLLAVNHADKRVAKKPEYATSFMNDGWMM